MWTLNSTKCYCVGHSFKSADNVPDLIDPNEKVSMEEINKRLVSEFFLAIFNLQYV